MGRSRKPGLNSCKHQICAIKIMEGIIIIHVRRALKKKKN